MRNLSFEEFKIHAKQLGIKALLKEIDTYANEELTTMLIYAVKNEQLYGCYGDRNGGMYFRKPMKQWSKSRRKFINIKV
jgi:hypothetical protein